jgi:hypothetical protein
MLRRSAGGADAIGDVGDDWPATLVRRGQGGVRGSLQCRELLDRNKIP